MEHEKNYFTGQLKKWLILEDIGTSSLEFYPPIIKHLLHLRGLYENSEAEEFLSISNTLFENPYTLPDIENAIKRLHEAKLQKETVAVFGDFDADGVTGTALLVKALQRFGLNTLSYIPHRVSEGHGLNKDAINKLEKENVKLIITVDCGVTNLEEIAYAKSLDIDTIVTDHHLTAEYLPDAVAIINPHAKNSSYRYDHLTGVGMTLKLSQALLQPSLQESWSVGLMELGAIGTITDMAPLSKENRYIVDRGIKDLRNTKSLGLKTLLAKARVPLDSVNASTIGFTIGPRINAAGRLNHADIALELMLTEDSERAQKIVEELDSYNLERRGLTEETFKEVLSEIPSPTPPVIVVGNKRFNPGVIGLVAGRISEQFGVPAAIFSIDNGQVMGSCRSRSEFHWSSALEQCDDLLIRHGGHAQAAGFTCLADNLAELTMRLESIASETRTDANQELSENTIEAEVEPTELMGKTYEYLSMFEPHGIDNPNPTFLLRNAKVLKVTKIGKVGAHFKLSVLVNGTTWDAIAFKQNWIDGTEFVDLVYSLEIDQWQGRKQLRLGVKDYTPSLQSTLDFS
tara:strand:- start:1534 stop:3249 length:1716 start_codon:yes stop_codon:yes gene_type:complete